MSTSERICELVTAIENGNVRELTTAIQKDNKIVGNVKVAELTKMLEDKIHFSNPLVNDTFNRQRKGHQNSDANPVTKANKKDSKESRSPSVEKKESEFPLKSVETGEQCVVPAETAVEVISPNATSTEEGGKDIVYNKMSQLQMMDLKRMAGVMDRFKKKKSGQTPEWSRNGSFLNKPEVGWIHPDQQLKPDAGICYGVRYIGNIEVKESMKSLDFDTRTQVAREAINRVAEAAGLKTATKKRKVEKRVSRMLGDNPHMHYAGANVNLTITTDSINLMVMETGEIIADHPMHVVSFASGGDAETLDFVSYVAKDPALGRACHVLECGGGLAEDVVTTVGQAFELRFKQYLQKQPKALQLPDRRENSAFEGEKWGDEEEYYNDHPGACPPSPGPEDAAPPIPPVPEYKSPCNIPVGTYASVKEDNVYSEAKEQPLIDFSDATETSVYDNRAAKNDSDDHRDSEEAFRNNVYDNRKGLANGAANAANDHDADPFDLESLTSSLADRDRDSVFMVETNVDADAHADATEGVTHSAHESESGSRESAEIDLRENPGAPTDGPAAPVFEEWYHGKIGRKQAEKLLELDGDFLVRESSNSAAQFVLSGKQNGNVRHLLLVDPEGIVRTKDFIFDSVSHLINYHRQNVLPIITQGSELRLVRPIKTCISAI